MEGLMQERRKIERQRTFLGALIVFNERTSSMECVVRNLSSEGARLSFDETQTIPERFELTIRRKKSTRCARIAWRGPTEAGRRIEELSTGY
jgi:hypothetical protein